MTDTTNLEQVIDVSITQNVSIVYFIIIITSCLYGYGCGVLCLCLCTFLCIAMKKMTPKKSHRVQRIYSNTETVNKDVPKVPKSSDIYSYAIPWNLCRFRSSHGRKDATKNKDGSIPAYAVRHSDLRTEFDLTYATRTVDKTQTV